jgi:hypothetical protein
LNYRPGADVPGFFVDLMKYLKMEEITGEEFYQLLMSKSLVDIENYSIIDDDLTIDISITSPLIRISNCNFVGRLNIKDSRKTENPDIENAILFHQCSFENVILSKCYLDELRFSSVNSSGTIFSISESQIYEFSIHDSVIKNDVFAFHHNLIINEFHLVNVKTHKGAFNLRKNKFSTKQNTFYRQCFIDRCQFFNCDISDNDFGSELLFRNNSLTFENNYSQNFFKNCIFNNASFYQTDLGDSTDFKLCTFTNTVLFDGIRNEIKTNLTFNSCNFKASTSFRKARIFRINFNHCIFENSTFFQDAYFDIIKLDNSIFEKNVFFDDVQIKQIDKCDRRTIRNIKLHLQKQENKIDYNKFRVYEFEAYKKDITKQITSYNKDEKHFVFRKRQIKDFKRDLFILKITSFFSEYGTDWKRALKCVMVFGFLIYATFYFSENYNRPFDLSYTPQFLTGYFRFFLVTDFYNPLETEREYISNDGWNHLLSWLIFILGKIVIAFGIYEMIQAFRKFKA